MIVYTKRLLLNKRSSELIFLEFMFKSSEEMYVMFSFLYINETRKYCLSESMKKTNPERYHNIEIYAKQFSFIVEQLENIYDGSLDLPISQLFCKQQGETLFQKIVSYILDIYLIYKFFILNDGGLLYRILFNIYDIYFFIA